LFSFHVIQLETNNKKLKIFITAQFNIVGDFLQSSSEQLRLVKEKSNKKIVSDK